MKIYSSTERVEPTEKEYYQLLVISMWEFGIGSVCYEFLDNGQLISYRLYKTSEGKREKIIELTQEMKDELIKMGYRLKN